MFSYYGSKSKIINSYPPPKYGKIIEPFAGSARYALKYWDRDVTLIDAYSDIIKVWKYLQNASEGDILGLPDVKQGDDIRWLHLSPEEKCLMGFCVNRGSAQPKNKVGKFQTWNRYKATIASNLKKIRHWKIILGDYKSADDIQATWFIDPPYQVGGKYYKLGNKGISYTDLADWCRSRMGQVIVCENSTADWLPFSPFKKLTGQLHSTYEVIWTNEKNIG